MKRWTLLVFALVVLVLPVYAQTLPLVVDDAALLTQDEVKMLTEKAQLLSEAYEMDVVILTVDNLGGKAARDFAAGYYDFKGYGQGKAHDGIMFMLAIEEREWFLLTTGSGIDAFPDSRIDAISDAAIHYFTDGDYFEGFMQVLQNVQISLKAVSSGAYGMFKLYLSCSFDSGTGTLYCRDGGVLEGQMNAKGYRHYLAAESIESYCGIPAESVKSIVFDNSVTRIDGATFGGYKNLKEVVLGDGLKEIGYTFADSSIDSMYIPKRVLKIGMFDIDTLESFYVDEDNPNYTSRDGVIYSKDLSTIYFYPRGRIDASYIVPQGVTEISDHAFFGCKHLSSVTLPVTVKKIGAWAFTDCSSLSSVYLYGDAPKLAVMNGEETPFYRTHSSFVAYSLSGSAGYNGGGWNMVFRQEFERDDAIYKLEENNVIPTITD